MEARLREACAQAWADVQGRGIKVTSTMQTQVGGVLRRLGLEYQAEVEIPGLVRGAGQPHR